MVSLLVSHGACSARPAIDKSGLSRHRRAVASRWAAMVCSPSTSMAHSNSARRRAEVSTARAWLACAKLWRLPGRVEGVFRRAAWCAARVGAPLAPDSSAIRLAGRGG